MAYSSILKMETAPSSEMTVNLSQTIRRHIPEGILYSHRHDDHVAFVPHSSRELVEDRLHYAATSPTVLLIVRTKHSIAGAVRSVPRVAFPRGHVTITRHLFTLG
jgi:hypothetical protein